MPGGKRTAPRIPRDNGDLYIGYRLLVGFVVVATAAVLILAAAAYLVTTALLPAASYDQPHKAERQ